MKKYTISTAQDVTGVAPKDQTWSAWFGDIDEGAVCGTGKNEADAIRDLLNNYDEPEQAANTPTPSAHSGEQGKPSDVVLRFTRAEFDSISSLLHMWPWASGKAWDAAIARSEELERKHEQSEPVVACAECRGSGEQSGGFCCPGCKGVGLVSEMDIAIAAGNGTLHGAIDYWQKRALRAEKAAPPPSEQAGISDEVVERAMRAYWEAVRDAGFKTDRPRDGVRAALQSAFPCGVEGTDIDAYVMDSGTVSVDVVLTSTKRVFSVMAMKDGSVGYAAYIDGDRYHGKIDAEAFGVALRKPLHEDAHPAPEAQAEEKPSHWAAIDDNNIEMSFAADDGNDGEAARQECNDWINEHGACLHLRPLYLHPQPSASETPSAIGREPTAVMVEAGAKSIRCDMEVGRTPQNRTAQRAARNAWVTMHDAAIAARKEGESS